MKYLIYLIVILLAGSAFGQLGNQVSTAGFASLKKRAKPSGSSSRGTQPIAPASSSSSSTACTSEEQTSLPLKEIDNLILEDTGIQFTHDPSSGIIKNKPVPWVGNCSDMITFELVKPNGDMPNLIFAQISSPPGCKNSDSGVLECEYEYIDVEATTGKSSRKKAWFEPNHNGFIQCLKTSGAFNEDLTPNEAKVAVSELKINLSNATESGAVWFASKGPLVVNTGALFKKKDLVKDCVHFESVIANEDGQDLDFNIFSRKDSISNQHKMKAAALCESNSHNLISKNIESYKEMGSLYDTLKAVNIKSLEDKIKKLARFTRDNYKNGGEEYKNLLGPVNHRKLRDLQNKLEIQYAKLENGNLTDDQKDAIEKEIKKLKDKIAKEDKVQISDVEDFREYVIEPLLVDIKELYADMRSSSLTEEEKDLKEAELKEKLKKLKNYRKSPFLTDKDLQRLFGKGPLSDEEFFEGVTALNDYRNKIKAYEKLGSTIGGEVRTRLAADLLVKDKNKKFTKYLKDKRYRYQIRSGEIDPPSTELLSKASVYDDKIKNLQQDLANLPMAMQRKMQECRTHSSGAQLNQCIMHYQRALVESQKALREDIDACREQSRFLKKLAGSYSKDEKYAAKNKADDDESEDEDYDTSDYIDSLVDKEIKESDKTYTFDFNQNPQGNQYGYNNQGRGRQPTIGSFYGNGNRQNFNNSGSYFNNSYNRFSPQNYGNYQSPWANGGGNGGAGLYFGLGNATGNYGFGGRNPAMMYGNPGYQRPMPYNSYGNGYQGGGQYQFGYGNGVRM